MPPLFVSVCSQHIIKGGGKTWLFLRTVLAKVKVVKVAAARGRIRAAARKMERAKVRVAERVKEKGAQSKETYWLVTQKARRRKPK